MRILIIFFLFSIFSVLSGQQVCFTYDAAGNRTIRQTCAAISVNGSENAMPPVDRASSTNAQVAVTGRVLPNPNNGIFGLELDSAPENASFILYDLKGQQIVRQAAIGQRTDFDISHLPAGNYILVLMDYAGHAIGKWTVARW